MTADGTASSNLKHSTSSGPIRWLVVGGALLIAAIMIGTTIMAGNFRERALNSSERELENTVLLLARHFDQQLEDFGALKRDGVTQIRHAGIASSANVNGQMSPLEAHEILRAKVSGHSDVAGVNLFDSDGMLINSSETWPVPDVKIADRAFFKAFKSGPVAAPALVELVQGRFTGDWATVISHKITGANGEFLGVVTRAITPATFEKFFASLALGEGAAISMYHRDGTMLARYPHIEALIGRNFSTGQVHQRILSRSDHGTLRLTSPVDGLDRLAAARALTDFPISIISTPTRAAALSDGREQMRFLIAAAGLSVLVIAAMLFLVVRKVSQQHRSAQQTLSLENQRLDTAVNNMRQGLLLFDSSERLIVCNQRYIDMYGLSAEVIKPGCDFREVIAHRKATGSFDGDVDEYCSLVLRDIGLRQAMTIETPDGRSIQVVNEPLADGGWRMGGDPSGHHRAHPRRTAHHPPCALRCAHRLAKPRIVARSAETGTGSHRSGRAIGRVLHRHRRVQKRQRFARSLDRR